MRQRRSMNFSKSFPNPGKQDSCIHEKKVPAGDGDFELYFQLPVFGGPPPAFSSSFMDFPCCPWGLMPSMAT